MLAGSTRDAVMRLSPYPVVEAEANVDALAGAEAVFITNVVWRALAVGALMPINLEWNSAQIAEQFCKLIDADRETSNKDHSNEWK